MKNYGKSRIMSVILISWIVVFLPTLVFSEEKQGVRVSLGLGAEGTFSYTDNTVLSGDFDHNLSGGALSVSFVKTNENNLFFGGGHSFVNVSAPRQSSSGFDPAYWTYNSSTYGYFDVFVTVTSFQTTFLFGLIGYELKFTDDLHFQPNLRIGLKAVNAKWVEFIDWKSYSDEYTYYSETVSGIGLEIDLPLMYRVNESFGFGGHLCICNTAATFTKASANYDFTSSHVINLLGDFYF